MCHLAICHLGSTSPVTQLIQIAKRCSASGAKVGGCVTAAPTCHSNRPRFCHKCGNRDHSSLSLYQAVKFDIFNMEGLWGVTHFWSQPLVDTGGTAGVFVDVVDSRLCEVRLGRLTNISLSLFMPNLCSE